MLGARILLAGIPLMQLTSIPELGKSPGVTPWISREEENAAITDLQAANFQLCAPGGGLCAQSGKPVALPKLFVLQFPPKFQGTDLGTDGTEPPRQLLPSAEPPPSPLPTKVQWEKPTGIQDRSLHHFLLLLFLSPKLALVSKVCTKFPPCPRGDSQEYHPEREERGQDMKGVRIWRG